MNNINYSELLQKLDECKTKFELVSVLKEYGIKSTTSEMPDETQNDFYFQFADKTRIQILKRSIKLLTTVSASQKKEFERFEFKNLSWDGNDRKKYTTVPKTPENLKIMIEYFLKDEANIY